LVEDNTNNGTASTHQDAVPVVACLQCSHQAKGAPCQASTQRPTLQGHVDDRAASFGWDVQDTLVSGLVDCIPHRFSQGGCHDVGVGEAFIAQQGAEQ
jgi:hypothetical protein